MFWTRCIVLSPFSFFLLCRWCVIPKLSQKNNIYVRSQAYSKILQCFKKKMFCWITSRALGIFPTCFPVIFPTFHCTKLFTSGRWLYARYWKHLMQGFISLCFVGVIKRFIFFSGIPKPSCHREQEDTWLDSDKECVPCVQTYVCWERESR